jgi:hypothetical protein
VIAGRFAGAGRIGSGANATTGPTWDGRVAGADGVTPTAPDICLGRSLVQTPSIGGVATTATASAAAITRRPIRGRLRPARGVRTGTGRS